ncbi:MAG TPA: GNAT family N-acetyltransferase [Xanthobacteraceae bacterium]|nr:GNAT family N-acetyltransferase [Xanthobacteraceae bacterium]
MTDDKSIEIKTVEAGSPLMAEILDLRAEVFVLEQGVPPELELDGLDEQAMHLAAIRDGAIVGTLRLLQDHGAAKIGRVAVRAALRQNGIGRRLMQRAETIISDRGFRDILLHAQITVAGFYRRLGYVEEGDRFDEAGIAHIAMRKRIV